MKEKLILTRESEKTSVVKSGRGRWDLQSKLGKILSDPWFGDCWGSCELTVCSKSMSSDDDPYREHLDKNLGNNNPVYETAKETLMYRTVLWTLWERERVGRFGRMALKHVKYHV